MSLPMYWLYSSLLALGLLVTLPYWLLHMLRHGKYRSGLAERLGKVPHRLNIPDAGRKSIIWVHAVSVGEVLAVSRLITEMQARFPKYHVLVSTTTDTGQRLARERFGASNVFYFPLDLGFAIAPYLEKVRPPLVIVAETELWPNFFRLAKRSGAKLAVVNARISDRSFSGYRRFRFLLTDVLKQIDLFLAQADTDRSRLVEIGAPAKRVQVSGNLKFDVSAPSPPPIAASLRTAFEHTGAGPVFVGGSLVEHGGHTILAPAQYGVPVVIGPHYENFRDMVDLFRAADAIRVVGPAELPLCFVDLLSDETERAAIGRRALETARRQT